MLITPKWISMIPSTLLNSSLLYLNTYLLVPHWYQTRFQSSYIKKIELLIPHDLPTFFPPVSPISLKCITIYPAAQAKGVILNSSIFPHRTFSKYYYSAFKIYLESDPFTLLLNQYLCFSIIYSLPRNQSILQKQKSDVGPLLKNFSLNLE